MKRRVTGIGGVFFKAKSEVASLKAWYEHHLGIDYKSSGGYPYWQWRAMENPERTGGTVFSIFKSDSDYFGSPEQQFMFNMRVDDLSALIEILRNEGVTIAGEIQEFSYGKFAWILDPDGNKIELWEPMGDSEFPGGMPMY